MAKPGLDSLLVGFGQAARSFHLPGIRKLVTAGLASGRIAVVDPAARQRKIAAPLTTYSHLPEPSNSGTVVHVCTPPETHADVVKEAFSLGYRRFIVEKPMATSLLDADAMVKLAEHGGADLLVMTNWSVSVLAAKFRELLDAQGPHALKHLKLAQYKPRFERTMQNDAHRSAFEVEMPHLLALCLLLLDEPLALVDAGAADLVMNGVRYDGMANAWILLEASGRIPVALTTDLAAPRRERSASAEMADGSRIVGYLPCDSSDRYSQLFTWDANGQCTQRQIFKDDTVSRFFHSAYGYFGGFGPRPTSDAHFGRRITAIISAATDRASAAGTKPEIQMGGHR